VAIGAMNDALHASYGDHAIRYTMLLATLTNVAACGFYLMAARSVRRDMDQRDA
jgi:hypothetical protein